VNKTSSSFMDIEISLSLETVGRLIKALGERGLRFPEDLDLWLQKVCKPQSVKDFRKQV